MTLKRTATRLLSEVYSAGGARRPAEGLRVLVYHSIGPALPGDRIGLSVEPEAFRRQIETIARDPRVDWSATRPGEAAPGRVGTAITLDDGYLDNLTAAAPVLSDQGAPFSVFVVTDFARRGKRPYLDAAALKELAAVPGCTIGSHGARHLPLTRLDDAGLRRELSESRAWLEDLLGRPVRSIAYPYGAADRRVRAAAAAAGYETGLCSRTGVNRRSRDPLLLCRTEILRSDGARMFELKLVGGWDWHRFRHGDPALR